MSGVEQATGEGPGFEALRTGEPTLLADVSAGPRWPDYRRELASRGYRSALGVPLDLGEGASAVLTYFGPATGLFASSTVAEAESFAGMASGALRVALRIAAAELHSGDLKAAMEHRTSVSLPRGIIMAQNRCSQEEAFEILTRVSNNRNQKLHTVADDIISRLSGAGGTPHFWP